MSQIVAVILASSVLLALAVAVRAVRLGRSAIAVAMLAAAVAAIPWFTQAHLARWDELRAPLVPVLAIAVLHLSITLVLRLRLRRTVAAPVDCPVCGHASPRSTDGAPAVDRPLACPECGTAAAEWTAVVRGKRARRAWRYRCVVHAGLGGFVFAMLALFVVPVYREWSEAHYSDISDFDASMAASTGMMVYRANFLHVLGSEEQRSILIAVDPETRLSQVAVLVNGIATADARARVGKALVTRGYDPTLADAALDAAVIAVSANNDGQHITLAPLHVGRWYLDLAWNAEYPSTPEFAVGMPGSRWILALLALAGAWALQPAPLTKPAAPHRPDRSRA